MLLTQAEIRKDPWKARKKIADSFKQKAFEVEQEWISEDGWAEDKEYRNEVIQKLSKFSKQL